MGPYSVEDTMFQLILLQQQQNHPKYSGVNNSQGIMLMGFVGQGFG